MKYRVPGATAALFAAVRSVEGVTVAERRNRGTLLTKCGGDRRGGLRHRRASKHTRVCHTRAPSDDPSMNADEKLKLLADASQYDLSCACGKRDGEDHRRRGPGGVWLYPASVPRGGQSVMLKTLLSNACVNDCRYCPFRAERDVRRCTLAPEEVASMFLDYARQRTVHGLFLTSGVIGTPDRTMEQMVAVAELLRRRHQYRGFLHLKIIPGSSDAAIEAALGMASAVSLNVEVPRRAAFASLSTRKDYDRDIVLRQLR